MVSSKLNQNVTDLDILVKHTSKSNWRLVSNPQSLCFGDSAMIKATGNRPKSIVHLATKKRAGGHCQGIHKHTRCEHHKSAWENSYTSVLVDSCEWELCSKFRVKPWKSNSDSDSDSLKLPTVGWCSPLLSKQTHFGKLFLCIQYRNTSSALQFRSSKTWSLISSRTSNQARAWNTTNHFLHTKAHLSIGFLILIQDPVAFQHTLPLKSIGCVHFVSHQPFLNIPIMGIQGDRTHHLYNGKKKQLIATVGQLSLFVGWLVCFFFCVLSTSWWFSFRSLAKQEGVKGLRVELNHTKIVHGGCTYLCIFMHWAIGYYMLVVEVLG